MAEFIELLERYGFSTKRRGASRIAIDALEQASGHVFPQIYRDFLSEFGDDPGQLRIGGDGWTTVGALMDHYHDVAEMADTPRNAIVISTSGLCDSQMIVSDGTPEGGPVQTFACAEPHSVSSSFRYHLFQCGWVCATILREPLSPPQANWGRVSPAEIANCLHVNGFRALWFSDSFGHYSERDDAWALIQCDQGEVRMFVRGKTPVVGRHALDAVVAMAGPPKSYYAG